LIALLSGNIVHKSVNQIIVDVNGVGYRLLIPLSSFYSLPEEGAVKLHVHTHVREDAISLFGFLTLEEKEMFVLLLTISGVGPKLALNILSNIPVNDLKCALTQGNVKQLSSLPGIGKKTAERLVLELKEKIPKGTFETAAAGTPATTAGDQREDALSALVNLGYKENLSKKALDNLEIAPGASLEETLKAALKILMR
jgi:Holliday junction DNA helicase RuvA